MPRARCAPDNPLAVHVHAQRLRRNQHEQLDAESPTLEEMRSLVETAHGPRATLWQRVRVVRQGRDGPAGSLGAVEHHVGGGIGRFELPHRAPAIAHDRRSHLLGLLREHEAFRHADDPIEGSTCFGEGAARCVRPRGHHARERIHALRTHRRRGERLVDCRVGPQHRRLLWCGDFFVTRREQHAAQRVRGQRWRHMEGVHVVVAHQDRGADEQQRDWHPIPEHRALDPLQADVPCWVDSCSRLLRARGTRQCPLGHNSTEASGRGLWPCELFEPLTETRNFRSERCVALLARIGQLRLRPLELHLCTCRR